MGQTQIAVVSKNVDRHDLVTFAENVVFGEQLLLALGHVRQVGFDVGQLWVLLAETVATGGQAAGNLNDLGDAIVDQLMQTMIDQQVALQQKGANVAACNLPAHIFERGQGAIQESATASAEEGG